MKEGVVKEDKGEEGAVEEEGGWKKWQCIKEEGGLEQGAVEEGGVYRGGGRLEEGARERRKRW